LQRARSVQSKPEEDASAQQDSVSSAAPSDDTDTDEEASSGSETTDTGVVREEMSEGDAYMRAGKYDIALRKFRIALALDPDNEDLPDRIERAEKIQAAEDNAVR